MKPRPQSLKLSILKSQPSTLNLEPSNLNPRPSILNPQPLGLNPKLQTLHQVDGGIGPGNIDTVAKAGANWIVAGRSTLNPNP
jgi:hypothetical protein